mgnify:CR=1 FL=1
MTHRNRQGISRRQLLQGGVSAAGLLALAPLAKAAKVTPQALAAAAQANGGVLVFAAESMGETLEPGLWNGFGSIHVTDNLGEGLIRSNFVSGEPTPGLAESWTISDDGLTYTFTLRSGATFQDGTPVDAAAVVRSFTRMTDDADPSYIPGLYMASSHGSTNFASIQALDDATVQIVLNAPDATQLHRLARPSAMPISPAALDAFGTNVGTQMVMAGPFALERFVPGQEAVLRAFDGYYGGRPAVDTLVIRAYPDEASILAALEAGEVQFTLYAPFTSVPRLQNSDSVAVDVGSPFVDLFLGCNCSLELTGNRDIRYAINYAINRETLIIGALNGFGELPASILSPTDLGFDESFRAVSTQNLELAAQHLAASGFSTPINVELSYENNRFWPLMAQLIKADLDAVGFNVTLDPLDPGSFWGKAGDGNMQLGLNQRSTFVPDPNDKATILHSITSPGALTYHETLESAPQMDALIDAGIAEQDPEARIEIYRQIQQLAIDEMMYVYLAYLTPPVFYARTLANVPSDSASSGRVNLSGVTFA